MDMTVCGLPLPAETDLSQPISAVVMVKGLDESGKIAYWTAATEDLMLTEAIGMAIAMADEFRDERRKT
jgi:hypothetical protein